MFNDSDDGMNVLRLRQALGGMVWGIVFIIGGCYLWLNATTLVPNPDNYISDAAKKSARKSQEFTRNLGKVGVGVGVLCLVTGGITVVLLRDNF